jgi:phosphoribosylaminoimidazole-succinocarboxamide synthase
MNKGKEVARGKTKVLHESPEQADVLVVSQLDNISAGDGARRNTIEGKGRLAAITTSRIFRLLNLCGLPTHYLAGGEDDDDNDMRVRRATMIPLEVVVRGVAAGSLVKRMPGIARGSIIVPRMVEFFLKDDANHDPLIEPDEIVRRGLATPQDLGVMTELGRITYEILAHAWRRRDTLLVDLKIEFGRLTGASDRGTLVIADVVDNDSWRIWPQGREELMLDKQMYRNLAEVTPADLERVRDAYVHVADQVATFTQLRPAMIAIVAGSPSTAPRADELARAFGQFGIATTKRVASASRTPAYALQVVAQLEVTYPRLAFVAIGDDTANLIDGATPSPVFPDRGDAPDVLAMAVAKSLALEDTVLFGRVLLVQAGARSAILQADARATTVQRPNGTPA